MTLGMNGLQLQRAMEFAWSPVEFGGVNHSKYSSGTPSTSGVVDHTKQASYGRTPLKHPDTKNPPGTLSAGMVRLKKLGYLRTEAVPRAIVGFGS
jgi:hypothetical protein